MIDVCDLSSEQQFTQLKLRFVKLNTLAYIILFNFEVFKKVTQQQSLTVTKLLSHTHTQTKRERVSERERERERKREN